jgi:single stranded DNA-binding protein
MSESIVIDRRPTHTLERKSVYHNHVFVIGRLTRDVVLRIGVRALMIADFSVAINETYDGKMTTTFVSCSAFGRLAQTMSNRQKGELVAVIGRLRSNEWIDKRTGAKRFKLYVIVDHVMSEIGLTPSLEPMGGHDDV